MEWDDGAAQAERESGGLFNFVRITNSLNMEDRHQRTFPLKVEEEINFKWMNFELLSYDKCFSSAQFNRMEIFAITEIGGKEWRRKKF